MGTEVEIIQPEVYQAEPEHLESRDAVQTGSPVFRYAAVVLGVLIALAFLMSLGSDEEEPSIQEQSTTTLAPRQSETEGEVRDSQPGGGPSSDLQAGTTTIDEWTDGQSLIVLENSQVIYELDLANGRRTSWAPPDSLVDTDPLVVGDELVVIAESGAWIGTPLDSQWRFLAVASRVLPSSQVGRLWLQTELTVSDSGARDYRWSEIDTTGKIYRSVIRDHRVDLATPEVAAGSAGGIMMLTEGGLSQWRPLSDTGAVVASGLNDLIVAECDPDSSCRRVWYDPHNGRPKVGFYPDLAENVDARFGSLLSPDGRFVVSRTGDDQTEVTISSVANGREIQNSCLWGRPMAWPSGSELVACTTTAGAELIRTDDGESLGMVVTTHENWTRMAFIATAKIDRSR